MASDKLLLSEFEAAVKVGISPTLLRWFTSYAPKQNDPRKLKVADGKGEVWYFDEQEIADFNEWLKAPWPHAHGERPSIPEGIKREIQVEANGECAICNSNGNKCEAAHIDPVRRSKNNHPENLIWLCSNHHTAFDKGLYGPTKENEEFVIYHKLTLHHFRKSQWANQHELSSKLILCLAGLEPLRDRLESATTSEQREAVERIARETLDQVSNLGPVSKKDPKYSAYQKIQPTLADLGQRIQQKSDIVDRLKIADEVHREYVAALGFVVCPLCNGSGHHMGFDCPVCDGEREIEESYAKRVDIEQFQPVECPLCKGKGRFEGEDCPECGGAGELQKGRAEEVDVTEYENVDCPLCDGSRRYEGDDCPVCQGDGQVHRRYAESVDLTQFELVDCPLCQGKGRYEGDDCPACRGDRQVQRQYAQNIDVTEYENVDCPLCDGSRRYEGDDCPVCQGDGQVHRRYAESVDLSMYDKVTCPRCRGTGSFRGDDCPMCDGEREVTRIAAERYDHEN